MGAPVISFVMGMDNNPFSAALKDAAAKLAGFMGVALSVGGAIAGVMKQIERGADLDAMARRTGVMVSALYRLQGAFAAVDVSSEGVVPALNNMQRALSGVSEMGEPTQEAFRAMKLNLADLKSLRADEAFQKILVAISRMNQADALKVAGQIFGRSMAGDVVQMSRSMDEFNKSMDGSKDMADLMQRNAKAFNDFMSTIARIKGKLSSVFASVAEGLIPLLNQIANYINAIDLKKYMGAISDFVGTISMAIMNGDIGELLFLSIKIGMIKAINLTSALFQGMWESIAQIVVNLFVNFPEIISALWAQIQGMMKAWGGLFIGMAMTFSSDLESVLTPTLASITAKLQMGFQMAFQPIYELVRKIPGGSALPEWKSKSYGDMLKDNTALWERHTQIGYDMASQGFAVADSGLREAAKGYGDQMKSVYQGSGGAFIDGFKNATEILGVNPDDMGKFKQIWAKNSAWFAGMKRDQSDTGEGGIGNLRGSSSGSGSSNADALTRIGAVFGGGGANLSYASQTARNTSRIATLMENSNSEMARMRTANMQSFEHK